MKKKLLMPILLISIMLSGCGNSEDTSPTIEDTDVWEDNTEYDTEYEETDADYEEDIYEEPEEVVLETYPFTKLRSFSDGRAWADFSKNSYSSFCTGVIDTDGKLVYQADSQLFYVSQFQDGLAFYRENNTEESPCGILDSEGNVLFESRISPDGGYLILAYGNGHFFVAQHIRSFDTDEWRYGTIDKDGNILNEMKASDEDFRPESWIDDNEKCSVIRYIGENFIVLPSGLYNLSTTHFSPFPNARNGCMKKIVGDFYDGYTAIIIVNGNSHFAYTIDSNYKNEGLWYETSWGWGGGEYDDIENVVSKKDDFVSNSSYGEGMIFGSTGIHTIKEIGYFDKDLNLSVSLEQYKENNISGGAFSGGYASITMTGADGDWYAALIDRQGNLVYSPIRIDQADPNNSQNGYLQVTIDGETKIIEPDGKVSTPGIDDLSMLNGFTFGDVGDGLICMDDVGKDWYYARLDGSRTIDHVKLMSGNVGSDVESSDASYIVPDSYDITGKWKSVGESGFGQAQPGAIVVFDGNNCNFYSPNDTYAFYKEDDRYVLDITSVLGESLSQTVNIIDDDNIEVAGASLMRIE